MYATADVGDSRTSRITFRRPETGAAYDPPVVLFKLEKPDGTVVEHRYNVDGDIVRVSEGVFACTWAFTQSGSWTRRWQALSDPDDAESALGADERRYHILKSRFANPILPT